MMLFCTTCIVTFFTVFKYLAFSEQAIKYCVVEDFELLHFITMHVVSMNISSTFSSNFKASTSKLLENLEEMLPRYFFNIFLLQDSVIISV